LKKINVAIDGPAGAGKSTVARMVAETLGFLYVDTGAMYRAIAWKSLKERLDPDDAEAVSALVRRLCLQVEPAEGGGLRVLVDGEDVGDRLRLPEVTERVSRIARHPDVRSLLVFLQRELARAGGVVMDGRDIGTVVLPNAEVKVFLTASPRARAERRFREWKRLVPGATLEQIEEEIRQRDRLDSERELSPLMPAPDAVVLDSTHLDAKQVAERILELCRERM